jgi:hypothetical protein
LSRLAVRISSTSLQYQRGVFVDRYAEQTLIERNMIAGSLLGLGLALLASRRRGRL